jgi:hypothetical protein
MLLDVCLRRRELGFEGVPNRETVMVLPTVNCLLELTQMPFTVVSLSDIEIVNLERVGFNLKNFDMAIVFKVGADGPFGWAPEGERGRERGREGGRERERERERERGCSPAGGTLVLLAGFQVAHLDLIACLVGCRKLADVCV